MGNASSQGQVSLSKEFHDKYRASEFSKDVLEKLDARGLHNLIGERRARVFDTVLHIDETRGYMRAHAKAPVLLAQAVDEVEEAVRKELKTDRTAYLTHVSDLRDSLIEAKTMDVIEPRARQPFHRQSQAPAVRVGRGSMPDRSKFLEANWARDTLKDDTSAVYRRHIFRTPTDTAINAVDTKETRGGFLDTHKQAQRDRQHMQQVGRGIVADPTEAFSQTMVGFPVSLKAKVRDGSNAITVPSTLKVQVKDRVSGSGVTPGTVVMSVDADTNIVVLTHPIKIDKYTLNKSSQLPVGFCSPDDDKEECEVVLTFSPDVRAADDHSTPPLVATSSHNSDTVERILRQHSTVIMDKYTKERGNALAHMLRTI